MMVVRTAVLGLAAGFLTRPCCVVPAVFSFMGIGAAGFGTAIVEYRTAFASASTVISFRRQGGWFNKALALCGTLLGFAFAIGWLRML